MQHWASGWGPLYETLAALRPEDLTKSVTIRGEQLSVPMAAQRSLAHTSYHVGQIALVSRGFTPGITGRCLTIPRGGSGRSTINRVGGRSYITGEGRK